MISFNLIGLPPSVNHYRRSRVIRKNGKLIPISYPSLENKQFIATTTSVITKIIKSTNYKVNPNQLYMVKIDFVSNWYTKKNKVRHSDIDNRIKPVLDALTLSGLMEDDSLIFKLEVNKVLGLPESTHITVCEYSLLNV